MTTFQVTCYEAVWADADPRPWSVEPWWEADRPWSAQPRLRPVGDYAIEATSPEDAADVAYLIGQNEPELSGRPEVWPPHHRSMSVGDVVVIDHDVALGCDRMAWARVTIDPDQIEAPATTKGATR